MQEADDIYAPPQASLEDNTGGAAAGALYSSRSVALATFLGSVLAGGVLLAINYRRLGRCAAAVQAIVAALLGEAAMFALAYVVPDTLHIPNIAYTLLQVFLMTALTTRLQGPALRAHLEAGGHLGSGWSAAGLGLLLGVGLMGALVFAADRLGG